MTFSTTKYEADNGEIHLIRIKTSRVAAAGTPPTEDQTTDVRVKVSKGAREFGIRPRGLRLSRTIGTPPNTAKKFAFIPILTPTAFTSQAVGDDVTLTVDGVEWVVAGKKGEDY